MDKRPPPISLRIPGSLAERVERARGGQPRNAWIREAIEAKLGPEGAEEMIREEMGRQPRALSPQERRRRAKEALRRAGAL